jgi:hypothetical protein
MSDPILQVGDRVRKHGQPHGVTGVVTSVQVFPKARRLVVVVEYPDGTSTTRRSTYWEKVSR